MLINFLIKFAKKKIDMKEVFLQEFIGRMQQWVIGNCAKYLFIENTIIHLFNIEIIVLEIYVTSPTEPPLLL